MSEIILSPARKAWLTRRKLNPEKFGKLNKEQKALYKIMQKEKKEKLKITKSIKPKKKQKMKKVNLK